MKKILLTTALLSNLLVAQSFFGFSANTMAVKMKSNDISNKISDSNFDLKLGLIVPNDYRTYISLSLFSKATETKAGTTLGFEKNTITLNYDEFSTIFTNYRYNVDYYVGMQFGLSQTNLTYKNGGSLYKSSDEVGLTYGLKTGLDLTLSDKFSIELGYKFNVIKVDETINGEKVSISNESGLFLGFNLKF